jgi:hypothetical protein
MIKLTQKIDTRNRVIAVVLKSLGLVCRRKWKRLEMPTTLEKLWNAASRA